MVKIRLSDEVLHKDGIEGKRARAQPELWNTQLRRLQYG
jgi:hypothetical protein